MACQQISISQVVRDGAPCHLHFDLEFAVAGNEGLEGEALVDALLALVAEGLWCAARAWNAAVFTGAAVTSAFALL